jgi:hypothetical protein
MSYSLDKFSDNICAQRKNDGDPASLPHSAVKGFATTIR